MSIRFTYLITSSLTVADHFDSDAEFILQWVYDVPRTFHYIRIASLNEGSLQSFKGWKLYSLLHH